MQIINSAASLRAAILDLERKQAEEGKLLREQFHLAYEGLKPINFIKSTIKEVTESEEIKGNLLNTGIGLTAGYLSEKLFVGISNNPLRKILGAALMLGVNNVVQKNPETVKTFGKGLWTIIRSKLGNRKNGVGHNEPG